MGSRLSGGMRDGLASQECHNTYQGELRISLSFSSCSSTIVGLLEPPQSPHPSPGVQLRANPPDPNHGTAPRSWRASGYRAVGRGVSNSQPIAAKHYLQITDDHF